MRYSSVVATRAGGPDVLQVIENDLRPPTAHEVRIKVLAAGISRTDVTARRGEALYSGTPLGQKFPFVPGYSVIGEVDAVGERVSDVSVGQRVGALTVVGGYTEVLYWRSDRLIPVPATLDPGEAIPLILNYIVAYQALHRSARARLGEVALIIGASGGIGTALLELGQLSGLKMYAVASRSKHASLTQYGATLIDYHTEDFAAVVSAAEPGGLDLVIDGTMNIDHLGKGLHLLHRGGRMVSFGEPEGRSTLLRALLLAARTNLSRGGRRFKLYGTSFYFLGNRRPFLNDWGVLFGLLEQGRIRPVIAERFPILEAARANELLESGNVVGNIVLVAPASS